MGAMSTLGLLMVNSVSADMLDGDSYSEGCLGPIGARIWLLIGLIASLGSFAASIYVMVVAYLEQGQDYAGAAIFLQNGLIFLSAILFKFGRGDTDDYTGW